MNQEDGVTSKTLREALLKDLLDRVQNGETVLDKDGEPVTLKASASVLTVAVNFLKAFPTEGEVDYIGSELTGSLKKYAEKMGHAPLQ